MRGRSRRFERGWGFIVASQSVVGTDSLQEMRFDERQSYDTYKSFLDEPMRSSEEQRKAVWYNNRVR